MMMMMMTMIKMSQRCKMPSKLFNTLKCY